MGKEQNGDILFYFLFLYLFILVPKPGNEPKMEIIQGVEGGYSGIMLGLLSGGDV